MNDVYEDLLYLYIADVWCA